MGDPQAREIEEKLGLPLGWMDTPPLYDEIHGKDNPKAKAFALLEKATDEQAVYVTRLLTAADEPRGKQGNGD